MSRPKIIRVWGKADDFDIEFHESGGRWICTVPPDTKDGQYAVEIHAINVFGEMAYWTGTLYMCNGVCHLELFEIPYAIIFQKECEPISFLEQDYTIMIYKEHEHAW